MVIQVAWGRVELPRLEGHRGLSSACLPFHHQAVAGDRTRTCTPRGHRTLIPAGLPRFPHSGVVGRAGVEPAQLWSPRPAAYHQALRPLCPPRESNPHASQHQGLGPACLPFHQRDVVAVSGLEPAFRGYEPREATTASLLRDASDWSRTSTPRGHQGLSLAGLPFPHARVVLPKGLEPLSPGS